MASTHMRRTRQRAALVTLLAAALAAGCMRTEVVSVADEYGRSANAQVLMNEALDRFLDAIPLDEFAGKSVQVSVGVAGAPVGGPFFGLMGTGVASDTAEGATGPAWSDYLRQALERRLAARDARCVAANGDVQLVVTKSGAGLELSAVYVPLRPLLLVDLYQHRTYLAVFDATVDVKSGDGKQVLRTQRQSSRSHPVTRPVVFASSLEF